MTPFVSADIPASVATDSAAPTETRIIFAEGIPGFQNAHVWELASTLAIDPFCRLRSVDAPPLQLLVVEASRVTTGYEPRIPRADIQRLKLGLGAPPLLLLVVTLWDDGAVTANLAAPLVINPQTMQGAQLLLEGQPWPLRYVLGTRDPA